MNANSDRLHHLSREERIAIYRRARGGWSPAFYFEMLGTLALMVAAPLAFFALLGIVL